MSRSNYGLVPVWMLIASGGAVGIATRDAVLLSIVTGTACWMVALLSWLRHERLTFVAVYGFSAGLVFGFGNTAAIALSRAELAVLPGYASPAHRFDGEVIALVGALASLTALALVVGKSLRTSAFEEPAQARTVPTDQRLVPLLLLGIAWGGRVLGVRWSFLGSASVLFDLGPMLAIFLWRVRSITAHGARRRRLEACAVGALAIELVYVVLTSTLRSHLLIALLAYVAPPLIFRGDHANHSSRWRVLLLSGLAALAFSSIFQQFGAARDRSTGAARVQDILSASASSDDYRVSGLGPVNGIAAIMVRSSSDATLSAVVRLTRVDGFEYGDTLEPLLVAPIPRVVWPGKPLISPGEEYARRLGSGYEQPNGTFSNSINITVPGDFYWNFGLVGTLLGSLFYGVVLGAMWRFVGRMDRPTDETWRQVGAFLLLSESVFLGSSAAAIVTIVTGTMAAWMLGVGLRLVRPSSGASLRTAPGPSTHVSV